MVATVRNLTDSSATSEYFRQDGGYYLSKGEDAADLRAKRAEHRNASTWHGAGAVALGLHPGKPVVAGAFEKLLQGHVIGTRTRLGRLRDGQHEHRPGFDITFSAPKSVSLAALLPTEENPDGDRAVRRAHDAAVRETLDWIEATLLETRGWDPATRKRPRVKAPCMVTALFRHIASRNLDPQLHTHAVIANVTRDEDGRWKSVEPTLLHRNARLIGAYYRDRLARQLIAKGYSILLAMVGRLHFGPYINDSIGLLLFQSWKPEESRDREFIERDRFPAGVMHDFLEHRLCGRSWLTGEEFTMADCAAAPALLYAGEQFPFAGRPAIAACQERPPARPSYVRVLEEAEPHPRTLRERTA